MNEKRKDPLRRRLADRRTREDRRSANELIKERGFKGASDYAADRIAALLEMNDIHGANVWRRIRAVLLDLSSI